MDIVTPVVVGVLLALFTGIQAWMNKGRFEAIEHRMDTLERLVHQLIEDVGRLRSDLLQVALAASSQQRPQTG